MTTVVISQPMLFPWVGLLEQIALADVYVHYTDVAWSDSSFVHRVQIKHAAGRGWLGIPIRRGPLGTTIDELQAADESWKTRHVHLLATQYRAAPFCNEMLELVESTHQASAVSLSDYLVHQLESSVRYLGIAPEVRFEHSSTIAPEARSTQRVLDIVRHFGGTSYVTGHGALRYLDHELLEQAGIDVRYMDYAMTPYPQAHGEFTPFVSVLDLIANVGRDRAHDYIRPRTSPWREFTQRSAA
jgi:WbqC-like protein family